MTNDARSEHRKSGDLCDLAGLPETLHRRAVGRAGIAVETRAHALGLDVAGAHAVDADVLARVLDRGALRDGDDAGLRGGVDAGGGRRVEAADRRPVHDRAAVAALEHRADRVLRAEHHAPQVDVHHAVVVLHRDVADQRGVADAGHVAHRVEPPELVDCGAHRGFDVGLLGDVAVHGDHGRAEVGRDVLLRAADVGGDDLGALAHERVHRRLGHARARARDHGDLAVQHSGDRQSCHRPLLKSCQGVWTRMPDQRTPREERPDVGGEQVGLLHRGEVAAQRHVGPVRHVVARARPTTAGSGGSPSGTAPRPVGTVDPPPVARLLTVGQPGLAVQARRRRDRARHPIQRHVGEQLVARERVLGIAVAVAPRAELLDDPREQSGGGVVEPDAERLGLGPLLESRNPPPRAGSRRHRGEVGPCPASVSGGASPGLRRDRHVEVERRAVFGVDRGRSASRPAPPSRRPARRSVS